MARRSPGCCRHWGRRYASSTPLLARTRWKYWQRCPHVFEALYLCRTWRLGAISSSPSTRAPPSCMPSAARLTSCREQSAWNTTPLRSGTCATRSGSAVWPSGPWSGTGCGRRLGVWWATASACRMSTIRRSAAFDAPSSFGPRSPTPTRLPRTSTWPAKSSTKQHSCTSEPSLSTAATTTPGGAWAMCTSARRSSRVPSTTSRRPSTSMVTTPCCEPLWAGSCRRCRNRNVHWKYSQRPSAATALPWPLSTRVAPCPRWAASGKPCRPSSKP
mmetsp:Transcript_72480/g.207945  ORF Transcript_72480/g.207945 Transcript_72480/m.207945 type:complete len:273 (+) Transcript_72480:215-1033(+)